MEETALKLTNLHYHTIVNEVWLEENYHYIDIMFAEVDITYKSEPENAEPHKCEGNKIDTYCITLIMRMS